MHFVYEENVFSLMNMVREIETREIQVWMIVEGVE